METPRDRRKVPAFGAICRLRDLLPLASLAHSLLTRPTSNP